jgi:hypothetical protein
MGANDDLVRLEVDPIDHETGGDEGQQAFGHRLRCAGRSLCSRSVRLRDSPPGCTTSAGEPKGGSDFNRR